MILNVLRSVIGLALLCSAPWAAAQTRLYCCADANGQKVCGDTLPQICYDRAYREMTPGGRILREVDPPMTLEQRARRDAELKAQREKAIREAEAKRRDRVLVESYASVKEIDARRDREVAILEEEVRNAKLQESSLLAARQQLDKRKPAKGPVPKDIEDDLATNSSELTAIRSVIDSKQRDIELIRSRFAADRTRFIELTEPLPIGSKTARRQ